MHILIVFYLVHIKMFFKNKTKIKSDRNEQGPLRSVSKASNKVGTKEEEAEDEPEGEEVYVEGEETRAEADEEEEEEEENEEDQEEDSDYTLQADRVEGKCYEQVCTKRYAQSVAITLANVLTIFEVLSRRLIGAPTECRFVE